MPKRDEFTDNVRRRIGDRAGYRCSNPTCRRLTTGPDPKDSAGSRRSGRAAHICAAAAQGPRYDPGQSTQERRHAENGIWLCAVCADVVDQNVDGYPVDALQAWKVQAERSAAREMAGRDLVGQILQQIETVNQRYFEFDREWRDREPSAMFVQYGGGRGGMAFSVYSDAVTRYRRDRRADYVENIAPLVADALVRAGLILGETHPLVVEMDSLRRSTSIDPNSQTQMAEYLQRLVVELGLE
jgi:hypothetical protein